MFILIITLLLCVCSAERHDGRSMCKAARDARMRARSRFSFPIKPCKRRTVLTPYKLVEGRDIFTFHDQDTDSVIVQMDLKGIDIEKTIERVDSVRALQKKARLLLNESLWGYNPLSFQFSNAVLFYPQECATLWKNNKELIKKHMPSVVRCHCNLFSVQSRNETFHMHHASAIGFQFHDSQLSGYNPSKQMSFHTTLLENNISTAPFSVFDKHTPEAFNIVSMIRHLTNDENIPENLRCNLERLRHKENSYLVREYVSLVYWEQKACSRADGGGNSSWWTLQPGDAVVFNNYRAHSDAGLGSVLHPRYSLDLRCFDKIQSIPWGQKYSWRALQKLMLKGSARLEDIVAHHKGMRCLPQLFNISYKQIEALFPSASIQEMIGSISGNLIDRPELSLLQNLALNQKYYNLVKRALNTGEYNVNAMVACLKKMKDDEEKIDL